MPRCAQRRRTGTFLLIAATALTTLLFTGSASAAAPSPVLYGAIAGPNATSDLYTLNASTGAATPIGPIGFAVTGLAQDPTSSVLYGVTSNNSASSPRSLITINPATGAGTLVGPEGLSNPVADISFTSTGRLFGWSEDTDDLVSIDKSTGLATVVGDSGQSTRGDGESFDKNDVLYDMSENDNGPLWTVDLSTGQVTPVATLTGAPNSGSPIAAASFACDRTTLYAIDNNFGTPTNFLVTVNTSTGAVSTIGPTGQNAMDALEWVCPVQIQLDAASASVNETAGSVTLSVSRAGGMKGAVSVNFSTANGSAIAGQDYSGASGTLTWANNDTAAKTITVPITNDNLLEGNETFTVNLSSPTAGAGLGTSSETVTIVNSLRPGACANLLNGTSGNDTLTGSSAGDNILGLGGNDVLAGLSGSDCLSGGTGNDKLSGGTGNDKLSGGTGNDRISGGSGKDRISGGSGKDTLSGSSGNDSISGGSSNDRIAGGSGSDRISVGSGKNRVSAGKGNDVVNAVNGKRDRINCGPGRRDRVRANRRDVLSGCEIVRLVR